MGSDWGAVHDRVTALRAGLDLEMPGPKPRRVEAVVEAVRSGELGEALLDEAVRRMLNAVSRAADTTERVALETGAKLAESRIRKTFLQRAKGRA